MVGYQTDNFVAALLAAAVAGMLSALIYGVLTVTFMANQNVTGLTLTIFGVGLANFIGVFMLEKSENGTLKLPDAVTAQMRNIHIPGLSDLPVVGELLFSYNPFVYLGIIIAISAYYYRYFSNYNFSVVTDKYTDNLADLTNDDKSERYNLQKQFRVKMYSVIYPNSAINPLWIVDDIPANEYIKNRYGLALDMDTNKIRFRVEEEVFGMKGYVGVDIKTGLSMYRSTKNDR